MLEDLIDRLVLPQLMLCAEIEELLLNGSLAPDKEVITILIAEHYGAGNGQENSPSVEFNNRKVKNKLTFLRDQWYITKNNEQPNTFKDIADMVEEYFVGTMTLCFWKIEAPTLLKLIQIILATAGTSEFSERTLSLARWLKSWLRLGGMADNVFDPLGLMAQYKDNLDTMLDLVKVGNEYIDDYKDNERSKKYWIFFTKDDFLSKTINKINKL